MNNLRGTEGHRRGHHGHARRALGCGLMLNYCASRVVGMFGEGWDTTDAVWWVWMFGCVEPCTFCDHHKGS